MVILQFYLGHKLLASLRGYYIQLNSWKKKDTFVTSKIVSCSSICGVSAGKRDQIDKKIFFEVIQVLNQMIKSTFILLRNFFLKKISIWSLFPAFTPYNHIFPRYIV